MRRFDRTKKILGKHQLNLCQLKWKGQPKKDYRSSPFFVPRLLFTALFGCAIVALQLRAIDRLRRRTNLYHGVCRSLARAYSVAPKGQQTHARLRHRLSLQTRQGEPAFSDKKAVANIKSEIYANLVLFLSNTLHISLNIEILCKNSVGQNHSNLELSFYIMQDSN